MTAMNKLGKQGLSIDLDRRADGWLAYPGTPEAHARRAAGVRHIGLQLRQNRRPLAETLQDIAHYVLPVFHGAA